MKPHTGRTRPTVEFLKDGPIKVQSVEAMEGDDGRHIPTKPVMALCRCGRSRTKPFCDGSHSKTGFSDETITDGEWDKRVNYVGKRITIHDNRGICSHAGYCTDGLPSVWRMKAEPWIDSDGAEVEAIIETIRQCPSGALSYTLEDVEHRDQTREPRIRLAKDGPYQVEGGVAIEGVERGEGGSTEHYALCRCGESKNKPFCDGTHWYVHFKGDNSTRVADMKNVEEGTPAPTQSLTGSTSSSSGAAPTYQSSRGSAATRGR